MRWRMCTSDTYPITRSCTWPVIRSHSLEVWMAAALLDGKQLAEKMQAETAAGAAAFAEKHGIRPGLAAVLVGDNPASRIYVRNKRKACHQAGLDSWLHELPADTTQAQLLDLINR